MVEPENETIFCPRCGIGKEDFDGMPVLCCESCDYCAHAAITEDICDFCGQRVELKATGSQP